jgi:hypothetical protein
MTHPIHSIGSRPTGPFGPDRTVSARSIEVQIGCDPQVSRTTQLWACYCVWCRARARAGAARRHFTRAIDRPTFAWRCLHSTQTSHRRISPAGHESSASVKNTKCVASSTVWLPPIQHNLTTKDDSKQAIIKNHKPLLSCTPPPLSNHLMHPRQTMAREEIKGCAGYLCALAGDPEVVQVVRLVQLWE